jgi:hypothetical protein
MKLKKPYKHYLLRKEMGEFCQTLVVAARLANIISYNYLIILFITGLA